MRVKENMLGRKFRARFFLSVCSYHVTYAFQSESKLYSCLNVKELLAQRRREIWGLSDCNWTGTHNHLVHKLTLKHGCGFESSCSHLNSFLLFQKDINCIKFAVESCGWRLRMETADDLRLDRLMLVYWFST